MGLGKTLTMISLIALDLETNDTMRSWFGAVMSQKVNVSATLIIIPPPCKSEQPQIRSHKADMAFKVIGTWEDELNTLVNHLTHTKMSY